MSFGFHHAAAVMTTMTQSFKMSPLQLARPKICPMGKTLTGNQKTTLLQLSQMDKSMLKESVQSKWQAKRVLSM